MVANIVAMVPNNTFVSQPDVQTDGEIETSSFSTSLQERERSLELAKYFTASSIVPASLTDPEELSLDSPLSAPDSTLTALAQLGAFRLKCDRSFISLIDRTHQYIIGEATRATSLLLGGHHLPSDGLYLGTRALELSFGVCPQTIQVFTSGDRTIDTPNVSADRTRYVIRDFCADPQFATRPYVTGFPHMRSYAEVPLTSSTGFVIGSYCVVDDKPRAFDNEEIAVLAQVASTIMNHLDLLKMKLEFGRVERLVRGIGSYVAGHSGLQEQQTKSVASRALMSPPDPPQDEPSYFQSRSPCHGSGAEQSSDSTSSSAKTSKLPQTPSEVESAQESIYREIPDSAGPGQYAGNSRHRDSSVSRDTRMTFSRAATLIRQSMEMQGVVVLDISRNGFRNTAATGSRSADQREPSRDDTPSVNTLGHSNVPSNSQGSTSSATDQFNIAEDLLMRLLSRYPFGHIFSFDEMGVISGAPLGSNYQDRRHPSRRGFHFPEVTEDNREDEDVAQLFHAIEQARSIIFVPLWDFQKDRWFASIMGWTTDRSRILGVGDLNYLSAFGNSIMAEVFRLETSALSQAKSDFISSVSHELRSPLHGILAGTELLRESVTSAPEISMLNTIDSCGNMPLDTMENLLDFAKINSLTGQRRNKFGRGVKRSDEHDSTRLSVLDLGELVQDVVEGVYLGHSSKSAMQRDTTTESIDTISHLRRGSVEAANPDHSAHRDLVVLVDIDPSVDWTFETEIGAWKRIVMNLFGNALKYTAQGQIEVKLRLNDQLENTSEAREHVCLQVNDTGQGIGKDFLQHRLYTPFAQENDLSVGTGLGLSIVQQLVGNLGGLIDVQSEPSIGTRINVMIPISEKTRRVPDERQLNELTRNLSLDQDGRLKGRSICLPLSAVTGIDPNRSKLDLDRTSTILALFADIADRRLGMRVLSTSEPDTVDEDGPVHPFVVLHNPDRVGSEWTIRMHAPARKNTPTDYNVPNTDIEAIISPPFGPRKLAMALNHALASQNAAQPLVELDSSKVAAANATNGHRRPDMVSRAVRPVHERAYASQLHPGESMPHPKEMIHLMKLLLVDDNAINLRVLSSCIKKLGCTYSEATNGREAVEIYKTDGGPFNLIFMDLSMPIMDGYTAAREIRKYESHAGLERSRIIALTALGSSEAKQEAFTSGIDLFISKPAKMSEVRELVAETALLRNQ